MRLAAPGPRATVIVPVLNQRHSFLRRALNSLSQTVPIEVVIVTSPKTPSETQRVIAEHCLRQPSQWIEQTRPGFAAAVNEGIQQATSKRIAFLLSDDWLDADAVESCLAFDADIVSSGLTIHNGRGRPCAKRVPTAAGLCHIRQPWDTANYLTHFLLLKRASVIRVGMLDESVGDSPGVDDFDLLWTMLEHSASVAVTEKPVYHYSDHAGLRLTLSKKDDMLRTFERILDKHHVTGDLKRKLRRDHTEWFGVRILTKMREMQLGRQG